MLLLLLASAQSTPTPSPGVFVRNAFSVWTAALQAQVRDKRTAESRYFAIDCSQILSSDEIIQSVLAISADVGTLIFDAGAINDQPVTLDDGRIVPTGQAVQVLIGGGAIPSPARSVRCIVRVRVKTSLSPIVEATVVLRLIDVPAV